MNEHDDMKIEQEEDVSGSSESEVADEEARADLKVKKLREELETVRKEKQEYLDGWQRSKADYVNVLKRSEGETKTAKMMGVVKAVEALLPAYDALERAKEHGEIPTGFQGIVKQLESAFASLGLEALGMVGEKFDPILHEALGQDPVKTVEEDDTVTTILEKGWRIGELIIRPAKVRVGNLTP